MSKVHRTDYILTKNQWYLHKNNKDATNNIEKAKVYKTWQGAQKRAQGTSWKYIRIDELDEINRRDKEIKSESLKNQEQELTIDVPPMGANKLGELHKAISSIFPDEKVVLVIKEKS